MKHIKLFEAFINEAKFIQPSGKAPELEIPADLKPGKYGLDKDDVDAILKVKKLYDKGDYKNAGIEYSYLDSVNREMIDGTSAGSPDWLEYIGYDGKNEKFFTEAYPKQFQPFKYGSKKGRVRGRTEYSI